MSRERLLSLDRRGIKYATLRDSETYRETKLCDSGAVNIIENDFVLYGDGKPIIRCPLSDVNVSELMNLSGIVIIGKDTDSGKDMKITAYFSDGVVRVKS